MEMTKYTVFVDAESGWSGRSCGDHIHDLAAAIAYAEEPTDWGGKFTPVAWMEGRLDPSKTCEEARAESIAAGRTIDLIAGKYIPRGVPGEPEKKEALFRIGGVYRNGNGDGPWVAIAGATEGFCYLRKAGGFNTLKAWEWRLSDGCWMGDTSNTRMRLLPGELVNRDGKWISVFESAAIDAGGCGVGLSKTAEPIGDDYDEGDNWRDSSCAKRDSDENHRPALTWDKPVRIDRFPGFVVKSDSGAMVEADNSPYTRLGDTSNPLHGSAHFANKG